MDDHVQRVRPVRQGELDRERLRVAAREKGVLPRVRRARPARRPEVRHQLREPWSVRQDGHRAVEEKAPAGDRERGPGRSGRRRRPIARVRRRHVLPERGDQVRRDVGPLEPDVVHLGGIRIQVVELAIEVTARPRPRAEDHLRRRQEHLPVRAPDALGHEDVLAGRQRAARHGDQVDAVGASLRRQRDAEEAEERRRHVDHLAERLRPAGRDPARGVEDERHAPEDVAPGAAVAEALRLLEELLAVVGGHGDHHRWRAGRTPRGRRRADPGGGRRSGGSRRRGRPGTRGRGRSSAVREALRPPLGVNGLRVVAGIVEEARAPRRSARRASACPSGGGRGSSRGRACGGPSRSCSRSPTRRAGRSRRACSGAPCSGRGTRRTRARTPNPAVIHVCAEMAAVWTPAAASARGSEIASASSARKSSSGSVTGTLALAGRPGRAK